VGVRFFVGRAIILAGPVVFGTYDVGRCFVFVVFCVRVC